MIARATHKRYANVMHWQLYEGGQKCPGIVHTNEKILANAINQVLEAMSMSNATHVSLVWTAKEGHIGCDN